MTNQDATHAIATKPAEKSWAEYVQQRAEEEERNVLDSDSARVVYYDFVSDEAPMTTDAPEPIEEPGYGHPMVMLMWVFALIGAGVTGIWLAKGAAAVARAAGWL